MDILKLLFIIFGTLLIVVFGLVIKNKFKKNYIYTQTLLEISNILKLEISFNKKTIKNILEEYFKKKDDDEIKMIFNNYNKEKDLNFNLLSDSENEIINNFFNKIGEYNLENTLQNIEKFIIELKQINQKYKDNFNKNGNLSLKLSICFALVFIIIFA